MIKLTSKMISCSTQLGCLLVLTQLLLQVLLLGLFPSSGSGSITLAGIENTTISWVVLLMVVHKLWCSFYHLQSLELLAFRGLSQMYVQTPYISNISAKAVTYLNFLLDFSVGWESRSRKCGLLQWEWCTGLITHLLLGCYVSECDIMHFYNSMLCDNMSCKILQFGCKLHGVWQSLIFKVRSYVIKYSS